MRVVLLGVLLLAGVVAAAIAVVVGAGDESEQANSADRIIFWTSCDEVAALTDEELDLWQGRGVDGFVCMAGRLSGFGGDQDFTADPAADLSADNYALQRSLADSQIAERAADRGMKVYLGAYLSNYFNVSTPLAEWFDDAAWTDQVLPRFSELAGVARMLGFAGVALDTELYGQTGGATTATWAWDYPGNTRDEAEVRAQARARGEQLMGSLLEAYAGLELAVYHAAFPGSWKEVVDREVHSVTKDVENQLDIDFWDGMTSADGYAAIRFWDDIFYKTPHRGTWDSALTYNQNQVFATFSRRWSNWAYASERVHVSPFSWIDPGPTAESAFDDARPPDYVEEQLLAFRKWGTGGEFANYVYGTLDGFDYEPYEAALEEASSPAEVDTQAPTVTVSSTPPSAAAAAAAGGVADDDLAVKAVRWSDDRGGAGVAELRWEVVSGDFSSGYEWETEWWIPADAISEGATEVTVTAEDIKGNLSDPASHELS